MNNTAIVVLAVTAAAAVAAATFLYGVNRERDRFASWRDMSSSGTDEVEWKPILGFAAGREG